MTTLLMLAVAVPARTAQRVEDLWLGIVKSDGALLPVTALIETKWWGGLPRGDSFDIKIPPTIEAIPTEWLPAAKRLPGTWTVHMFSGRTTTLQTTGPVVSAGSNDEIGLATNLRVGERDKPILEYGEGIGVALAGSATLRLFRVMPRDRLEVILRFSEVEASKAERAALDRAVTNGHMAPDSVEPLTDAVRQATPFDVESGGPIGVTLASNGDRVHYIEWQKRYRVVKAECQPLTIAAAVVAEDRSGTFRVVHAQAAATDTCEVYITQLPLATVERDGVSCWILQLLYEDGDEFLLVKPASGFFGSTPEECTLR